MKDCAGLPVRHTKYTDQIPAALVEESAESDAGWLSPQHNASPPAMLNFYSTPLKVPVSPSEWDKVEVRRRAGVRRAASRWMVVPHCLLLTKGTEPFPQLLTRNFTARFTSRPEARGSGVEAVFRFLGSGVDFF